MEQPSPSTDAVLGVHEGRVLVAEDDEASRALTTEVLRRAGYEAVAVTDGMQALEVLADGTIDLALLDIGLPGVVAWRSHVRYARTDGSRRSGSSS
jgi:CheY-like chemotaxis protein